MRKYCFILLPLLIVSCKNGCNSGQEHPKKDSLLIADNNPLTADSITPTDLKDTLGMDELAKDSLKFAHLFQKEANRLMRAEQDKNYDVIASFVPPEIIKKTYKGKENYIARLKQKDAGSTVMYDRIVCGPVKRVAPAVDENMFSSAWYCLMPVRSFRTIGGKKAYDERWLGGQASVDGKQVYFLDITAMPREVIGQVMPDLVRFVLDPENGNLAQ